MKFTIPPSWWEPCVWWLQQCEWTKSGHSIKGSKNGHICTWMEMNLAFQIQTGIRLAPNILDMRSQEYAFKRMVRSIWSKSKCMQGAKYATCKQTWGFAAYITSLVPVVGHSRAGICRRPMLSNEVWKVIVGICERANLQGRCAATFGKHIRTFIPHNSLCICSLWWAACRTRAQPVCTCFVGGKIVCQNAFGRPLTAFQVCSRVLALASPSSASWGVVRVLRALWLACSCICLSSSLRWFAGLFIIDIIQFIVYFLCILIFLYFL
jgi:hypothetical protein